MSRLKVGDRVSRQIVIGQPERRYGVVTAITKSKQSFSYPVLSQFSVRWDGQTYETHGYFEEGLQSEPAVTV